LAVKVVHVSDLSGQQADESEFGRLIVREHPDFAQTPITLEVLPNEIGRLPESEPYVRLEYIAPGERAGQQVTLTLEKFNQLSASKDMKAVLLRALAEEHQAALLKHPHSGGVDFLAMGSGRRSTTPAWSMPANPTGDASPMPRSSSCVSTWRRSTPGWRLKGCGRLTRKIRRCASATDWSSRLPADLYHARRVEAVNAPDDGFPSSLRPGDAAASTHIKARSCRRGRTDCNGA